MDGLDNYDVDLKCVECGKEVHTTYAKIMELRGWCRFQFAQNFDKATPWFCCAAHLMAWLTGRKQEGH